MIQLGSGFTYIGNEFKIKLGDRYNYINLFLYNIKYKCYVDKYIKTIDENDTVGIIICKKNNQYVIDYCSDKRILSREYELVV